MTAPEQPTTCQKMLRTADWGRRRPCGKPAKGTLEDGTPACGAHIGGEKRSKLADERGREEYEREQRRHRDAKEACDTIARRCPTLEPSPYKPPYGPLRGGPNPEYVVVRVDALLAILGGPR